MARVKKEKEVIIEKANEQLEVGNKSAEEVTVTQEKKLETENKKVLIDEESEQLQYDDNETEEKDKEILQDNVLIDLCNKTIQQEEQDKTLGDDIVIKFGDKVIPLDDTCDDNFIKYDITENIKKVLNETVTYDLETLALIKKIRDIID